MAASFVPLWKHALFVKGKIRSCLGETLIVNHCSEGVECNDDDHAKNCRAELKLVLTR